jgi:hypothetical protein
VNLRPEEFSETASRICRHGERQVIVRKTSQNLHLKRWVRPSNDLEAFGREQHYSLELFGFGQLLGGENLADRTVLMLRTLSGIHPLRSDLGYPGR